jgi:type II secretory pathway pseudopilin PulG
MSDPDSSVAPEEEKSGCRGCIFAILAAITLLILFSMALGPISPGIHKARESSAMQQTRTLYLGMFSYANDHNQQYPSGKSSTAVFQELLDGGYVSDPSTFYLPLPGKTPPIAGQKLKPENIGFDITSEIDENSSSDQIPVVFETGYKIRYEAGGAATLLPQSGSLSRTWEQWWNNVKPLLPSEGIAVAYKSGSSKFLIAKPDLGGTVPNFVPPDFKPDEKTYRQLTPDGVLP